jgi:hypothetical protein
LIRQSLRRPEDFSLIPGLRKPSAKPKAAPASRFQSDRQSRPVLQQASGAGGTIYFAQPFQPAIPQAHSANVAMKTPTEAKETSSRINHVIVLLLLCSLFVPH